MKHKPAPPSFGPQPRHQPLFSRVTSGIHRLISQSLPYLISVICFHQATVLAVDMRPHRPGPAASNAGPYLATERQADEQTRYSAELVAPIPAALLGGMFFVDLDASKTRLRAIATPPTLTTSGQSAIELDTTELSAASLGLRFLPHSAEGAPRFFLEAKRHTAMSLNSPIRPIQEFRLGTQLDDQVTKLAIKPSTLDQAQVQAYVQIRLYPGFTRWWGGLGHSWHQHQPRGSGYYSEILLPTHMLFGYNSAHQARSIYTGLRREERAYPMELSSPSELSAWYEGYALRGLVGFRQRLFGVAYLNLETGYEKLSLHLYDERGREVYLDQHAPYSANGWFARLALESWFSQPP